MHYVKISKLSLVGALLVNSALCMPAFAQTSVNSSNTLSNDLMRGFGAAPTPTTVLPNASNVTLPAHSPASGTVGGVAPKPMSASPVADPSVKPVFGPDVRLQPNGPGGRIEGIVKYETPQVMNGAPPQPPIPGAGDLDKTSKQQAEILDLQQQLDIAKLHKQLMEEQGIKATNNGQTPINATPSFDDLARQQRAINEQAAQAKEQSERRALPGGVSEIYGTHGHLMAKVFEGSRTTTLYPGDIYQTTLKVAQIKPHGVVFESLDGKRSYEVGFAIPANTQGSGISLPAPLPVQSTHPNGMARPLVPQAPTSAPSVPSNTH